MRLVTVVSGPGLLRWSSNARGSPFRVSTISRRGRTLPAKYPLNPVWGALEERRCLGNGGGLSERREAKA